MQLLLSFALSAPTLPAIREVPIAPCVPYTIAVKEDPRIGELVYVLRVGKDFEVRPHYGGPLTVVQGPPGYFRVRMREKSRAAKLHTDEYRVIGGRLEFVREFEE